MKIVKALALAEQENRERERIGAGNDARLQECIELLEKAKSILEEELKF